MYIKCSIVSSHLISHSRRRDDTVDVDLCSHASFAVCPPTQLATDFMWYMIFECPHCTIYVYMERFCSEYDTTAQTNKKTNSEITLGPFFPRLRRINFLTTFVFVVVPFWFSTTFNSGWVLIFIARAQHRSNLRRLFVTTSSDSHLFLCPSLVHRSMPCSINYSVTPTHAERGKPEWLSDTKNWMKKKNRW